MSKFDYDMIVIGGGAAGLTASTFAGASGAKTLLIEKEEKLGGDCLHYGCVPSKALIKSAYAYHVAKNSSQYGLPKIDMPEVDFKDVRGRIKNIIGTIQKHDEPEYLDEHFNVESEFGAPVFVEANTIELNGRTITSRYFVIGTGSAAAIPAIEGINEVPYITNVEIFSLDKLPRSMIILGGGPIGMEMAQSFNRLGSQVTVVEYFPRVLAREDEDVSDCVESLLRGEGVEFFLGAKAVKTQNREGRIYVTLETDGKQKIIDAEVLLVATGRKPNVEGLNLENAGIQFSSRGIKVNEKMQTNVRNIYACGDVNGSFPFTHVAAYESGVAVTNAILKIPKKADYTNVPWCTYLDPEVASIGYNETRAKQEGIDVVVHKEEFAHNDRALAEGETKGFVKLVINKKGVLIGVQIVGFHAGDLIHEWVAVLNGKISLSSLSGAIHAYPTMSELNKRASENYIISTIPTWTKKVLKFIFRYQGKV